MTSYRIGLYFSVIALIPLSIAFFLPIVKLENVESGSITHLWMWGLSVYSSDRHFGVSFPFIIISFCMLVDVGYLFKSWLTLRRGSTSMDVVSRYWIQIGLGVIGFEFGWLAWLLCVQFLYIFYRSLFEFSFFLPLLSGLLLIIAGRVSKVSNSKEELEVQA